MKKQIAFTLSEVLITLAIIGVISAISVPTLLQKTNQEEMKVAYKKAYAVASQAYDRASFDGVLVARNNWGDTPNNIKNFNAFKTYFKVIKDCNSNNNDNCWDSTGEKYFTLYPEQSAPAFIDASGVAWSKNSGVGTPGDEILLDVNGFKKPNKFGRDRFRFLPVVDGLTETVVGIPNVLTTSGDVITVNTNSCPSGGCYYTSWIAGK